MCKVAIVYKSLVPADPNFPAILASEGVVGSRDLGDCEQLVPRYLPFTTINVW